MARALFVFAGRRGLEQAEPQAGAVERKLVLDDVNALLVDEQLRNDFTAALGGAGEAAAAEVLRVHAADADKQHAWRTLLATEQPNEAWFVWLARALSAKAASVRAGSAFLDVAGVAAEKAASRASVRAGSMFLEVAGVAAETAPDIVDCLQQSGSAVRAWLCGVQVLAQEAGSGDFVVDAATGGDLELWCAEERTVVPRPNFHISNASKYDDAFLRVIAVCRHVETSEGRRVANGVWRGLCTANQVVWQRDSFVQFVFVDAARPLELGTILPHLSDVAAAAIVATDPCAAWAYDSVRQTLGAPDGLACFFLITRDAVLQERAAERADAIVRREAVFTWPERVDIVVPGQPRRAGSPTAAPSRCVGSPLLCTCGVP